MSTLRDILDSVGAPNFGEYWKEQGGILRAYCPGKNDDPDRLFITGKEIGKNLVWGPYGEEIAGADSHTDGRANTVAIAASGLDCPAINFVAGYEADGHSDFWLPARRELNLIEAFGFADDLKGDFWSSTQYSADFAWDQYFGYGFTSYWSKCYKASVLALRSYILR